MHAVAFIPVAGRIVLLGPTTAEEKGGKYRPPGLGPYNEGPKWYKLGPVCETCVQDHRFEDHSIFLVLDTEENCHWFAQGFAMGREMRKSCTE